MEHYSKSRMESIEIMRNSMSADEYRGFLIGNVYKYVNRYRHKGTPIQDLTKAVHYLQALLIFEADPECDNPFKALRNGK